MVQHSVVIDAGRAGFHVEGKLEVSRLLLKDRVLAASIHAGRQPYAYSATPVLKDEGGYIDELDLAFLRRSIAM